MDPTGMALPGLGPFSVASTTPAAAPASTTSLTTSEDLSKKIRKPYTITKSRESWTEPEHDKFLEALQLFDRDWKKIEAFIGSKTAIQIRSHAQKYFLKVEKSGATVHLPPPRPKRKAAHAYPQKASKNGSFQSSASPEPGYIRRPDSLSMPMNTIGVAAVSSWTNNVPIVYLPNQSKGSAMPNNCLASGESTPGANKTDAAEKENQGHTLRVLPDFVQVYNFIGSIFDPNVTGHLQKLKQMDPIDVDTVLLLMRNLSTNLASPNFDVHRKVLSSYEIDADIAGADKTVIQATLQ